MADLKIVNLIPKAQIDRDHHHDEVIRLLEEALVHARNGDCQSLALLMIDNEGNILDCWHNGGRPYVMVGAFESMKLDFINAHIEGR